MNSAAEAMERFVQFWDCVYRWSTPVGVAAVAVASVYVLAQIVWAVSR